MLVNKEAVLTSPPNIKRRFHVYNEFYGSNVINCSLERMLCKIQFQKNSRKPFVDGY